MYCSGAGSSADAEMIDRVLHRAVLFQRFHYGATDDCFWPMAT